MVPDGVEEVELAKVDLEQKERAHKLLLDDIRKLSLYSDTSGDLHLEKEGDLWMITGGRSILVRNRPIKNMFIFHLTASLNASIQWSVFDYMNIIPFPGQAFCSIRLN